MKRKKFETFKIDATLVGTITGGTDTRNHQSQAQTSIVDPFDEDITIEEDANDEANS